MIFTTADHGFGVAGWASGVVNFNGFKVCGAVFFLNNGYYCGGLFRFSEILPASGLPAVVWSGVGCGSGGLLACGVSRLCGLTCEASRGSSCGAGCLGKR